MYVDIQTENQQFSKSLNFFKSLIKTLCSTL